MSELASQSIHAAQREAFQTVLHALTCPLWCGIQTPSLLSSDPYTKSQRQSSNRGLRHFSSQCVANSNLINLGLAVTACLNTHIRRLNVDIRFAGAPLIATAFQLSDRVVAEIQILQAHHNSHIYVWWQHNARSATRKVQYLSEVIAFQAPSARPYSIFCGQSGAFRDCVSDRLEGRGIRKSECPTCHLPIWKKDLIADGQLGSLVSRIASALPGLGRPGVQPKVEALTGLSLTLKQESVS